VSRQIICLDNYMDFSEKCHYLWCFILVSRLVYIQS